MDTLMRRLASFSPARLDPNLRWTSFILLAKKGFYYDGVSKCVRCHKCNQVQTDLVDIIHVCSQQTGAMGSQNPSRESPQTSAQPSSELSRSGTENIPLSRSGTENIPRSRDNELYALLGSNYADNTHSPDFSQFEETSSSSDGDVVASQDIMIEEQMSQPWMRNIRRLFPDSFIRSAIRVHLLQRGTVFSSELEMLSYLNRCDKNKYQETEQVSTIAESEIDARVNEAMNLEWVKFIQRMFDSETVRVVIRDRLSRREQLFTRPVKLVAAIHKHQDAEENTSASTIRN